MSIHKAARSIGFGLVGDATRSSRRPNVIRSTCQHRGTYRMGRAAARAGGEPLLEWGDDVDGIAAGTFRWRSGAFGGVKADCTECRSTGLGWAGETGAWMRGAGRS
jgi:hypothetical protein